MCDIARCSPVGQAPSTSKEQFNNTPADQEEAQEAQNELIQNVLPLLTISEDQLRLCSLSHFRNSLLLHKRLI